MERLSDFIKGYRIPAMDGHIHTFSHRGVLSEFPKDFTTGIGFADIELDHLDSYKDMVGLYGQYATNPNILYLATGLNIKQVSEVYDYLQEAGGCYGFGELKLYDRFKDKDVPFKRISFADDVCKFSESHGCKPVYIHYELNTPDESGKLSRLLERHPEVPIVLCHGGMNDRNQEFAYSQCAQLGRSHGNLWVDISWDAAKWFSDHPMLLLSLPPDRTFWGSDYSPRLVDHGYTSASPDEIIRWRDKVTPYIHSDTNLSTLFG